MILQEVHLGKYGWTAYIYYAIASIDAEDIADKLREVGCGGVEANNFKEALSSFGYNAGFTYSNPSSRQSVMVIGPTTSAEEFQSTFDHEKGHLAMHIAETFGIDPFGEEYQYLTGEIGRKMFPVAKRFLCDCCRRKIGIGSIE